MRRKGTGPAIHVPGREAAPTDDDEQVQQIVANAASVHVLGSRHSFNDIAGLLELISAREPAR